MNVKYFLTANKVKTAISNLASVFAPKLAFAPIAA